MKYDDLGDGWSKVTVLDPETSDFYNRYYYKRVKAKRIEITTPKAQVLASYTLIEKDLRSVAVWLNEIESMMKADVKLTKDPKHRKSGHDRTRYNLIKGLFVAALTFYAKCFATCEGRKVKLEKKNLDDDFQKKHQLVIDLRNNFAAHSGAEKVEKVKVVLALDTKRRKGAVPYFTRELGQPDSYTLENIADFRCLVEHVKSLVDEKINTLNKKVLQDDIISKGGDYWYNET
ncbi:hypothetical protein RUK17_003481 [Vibrio cholerae]|nr:MULTISPECIES: hypothetical protein [Vibrio]EJL6260984.1 hypothetical protein [Vibrio cholerae]EKF9168945.1 hypothetical protein [Vibrio cholerae]EKF9828470.1 hypothetical protein [Vibrio cholerae]ELJ8469564.1 hypothetical protein [Vibrio cholerae]MBJ6945516.1 hypothetical protein [Vibrio cholerae]